MNKNYRHDLYRYYGRYKETIKQRIVRPDSLKYMRVFRKYDDTKNGFMRLFYYFRLRRLQKRTFIQIPCNTKIGKGFYIGHNGRIIIN